MRLSGPLVKRLLPRARRYFGVNFVHVLQQDRGDARRAVGTRHPIQCRELDEDEVLAFAADPALELDRQWVRETFARGAVCLGALKDGRLVGYSWLAYGGTPYAAGVWVEIDRSLRYSYKSFVRPEYRGQRIIQALHALGDRPELWRGRRASVSFVTSDNFASLSSLERVGARVVGYASYARVFGMLVAFRSPGVRRAGIRLRPPPPAGIADTMPAWPDRSPRSSA